MSSDDDRARTADIMRRYFGKFGKVVLRYASGRTDRQTDTETRLSQYFALQRSSKDRINTKPTLKDIMLRNDVLPPMAIQRGYIDVEAT